MSKTQSGMVQATVVEDSIAPSGVRLTTMLLTYATMVHQDLLTHRTMYKLKAHNGDDESVVWMELDSNKSTNSNRAKPTRAVLSEVLHNPFCPAKFPVRAATMHSSRGYLVGWRASVARQLWLKARYVALFIALLLMWVGVHKQIANRLLMPWTYTTLVMTAVDAWWEHFFRLRNHYMAQDEVQDVARTAHIVYHLNAPTQLQEGEWHMPFIDEHERSQYTTNYSLMLSVARCARTSYASDHETMMRVALVRDPLEDTELFYRLATQTPEHAGPKEHQGCAHSDPNHVSGTLVGWDQLRHHPTNDVLTLLAVTAPTQSVAR